MNKKLMCTLLTLLVILMPTSAASANGTFQTNYQVISSVDETIGGLVRTVEIVQAGPNPIDKFEVVHVRHPDPSVKRGSILLAPGIGTGFQLYETSDTPYYRDSFAGFLSFHAKLVESGVPAINLIFPCTDHVFDLLLPQINPAAQSALYDVDRFLALLLKND